MKKHIAIACLYTLITALVLGLIYLLVITGLAKVAVRDKADGQLIVRNGEVIGSRLIGQPFTGPGYFHGRPSAAGTGYDASASSGSNLAPTSKALIDRVNSGVSTETAGVPIPIDLVTASGSGLAPDISPAAALYQVAKISRERRLPEAMVRQLVTSRIKPRQFGLLGEPSVNVLSLNITLDQIK
jgi:potassium-transporting ATPase KdpC subunit